MEGIPGEIEIVLPDIPADASDEKKVEVLQEINEKLVDAINAEDERKEHEEKLEEQKPKFGSGLAVLMDLENHPEGVWLDENQVDVDTGKKLNLSPEAQKS